MVDWLDVGLSLVGNGFLIAIVLLLLRSHLDARNDRGLAELNSQLGKLEIEYTTRLTELHRRRADAISRLYKLLARAERKLKHAGLMVPRFEGEERDLWKRAAPTRNAIAEMVEFYEDNKVLFTSGQVELMDSIADVFSSLELRAYLIDYAREAPDPAADDDVKQRWGEAFKEARSVFETTYPSLREQLELDFRKILGVSPGAGA